MDDVEIRRLEGDAIAEALDDLARLRIAVFRDWPYLYAGTLDYERRYLGRFAASPRAFVVGAFAGGTLVGAATALPLADEHADIRAPFDAAGEDVSDTFYLAESVLLPAWRGRGIGHAFFDHREDGARALGYRRCVFCAVVRPEDHPLRPPAARSLEPFWRRRGYRPLPGVVCRFAWTDVGEIGETEKALQFWERTRVA